MEGGSKISRDELLNGYKMLGKMSELLEKHNKDMRAISKTIAKRMKSNMRFGLVDNLEITLEHMNKARKELRKAQRELKAI